MKQKQLLRTFLAAVCLLVGQSVWADRVYFNDFSTGNGTTAPEGLTIHGDGSFVDDADANFGKVFQNGGGAQRTHYLQLPNDVLSHSSTSKKMTIGFWVNAKNAGESNSYMWAPIFTAYAAAPSNNTNTSPMFACQYRGVLQVNNSGWCDYVDQQNVKGSNTLYHGNTDWLADDGWHYYTAVFDGENAYVYFDGVLKNQWLATTDYNDGTSDITNTTQDGLFTAGSDLTYVCLGGNQVWNFGDNDAAFMFDDFAVYDEALAPSQIAKVIADKKGLTEETYDFAAANTTSSSSECTYGAIVKINSYDCSILSSGKLEMNDRFAGRVANGSKWYIYRNSGGIGTSTDRTFGILNLAEGDYVSITFTGSAPTFIGNSNISGKASGTAVVSGDVYKMSASGNLELNVPKSANNSNTYIKSISIFTSKPVLSKPTITFSGMVESAGVYNPKYTFSSTDDDVTYYDGDGNDISNGYTFTTAGTLTYYAGKAGRTNSAKQTYTVTSNQVGMILTNSIDVRNLYGVSADYNNNEWPAGLDYTLIPNVTFNPVNNTQGCTYRTKHNSTEYNTLYARNKAFTATCSNLSEDEMVIFADYTGKIYTPCTSTSNSISVSKDGSIKYYNLYTQPTLTQSITVSDAEWKTLVSQYSLDFTSVEGLKAYIVTGGVGGVLTKTQVKKVPAGTALLLNGSATTYDVPVIAKSAATDNVTGNKLVGVVTNKEIAAETGYVLLKENNVLGFYKNSNAFTLGANTAYLPVSFDQNGAARASYLLFDDMTGISQVAGGKVKTNGVIYNLNGQRVTNPTKGIYIIDGVKVAIE
ncbi:MAG: hypothetical protein IKN75_06810 [Prevotella sp.]|nr:hypothetical protein [Prevotella sp.]